MIPRSVKQLLDVAQAQGEAGVEPDGVLDDEPGEAEAAGATCDHAARPTHGNRRRQPGSGSV